MSHRSLSSKFYRIRRKSYNDHHFESGTFCNRHFRFSFSSFFKKSKEKFRLLRYISIYIFISILISLFGYVLRIYLVETLGLHLGHLFPFLLIFEVQSDIFHMSAPEMENVKSDVYGETLIDLREESRTRTIKSAL